MRHLAGVEQYWFRTVMAGQQVTRPCRAADGSNAEFDGATPTCSGSGSTGGSASNPGPHRRRRYRDNPGMAVIYNTTMNPGKLELLAAWLPDQPWYQGTGRPELTRVGGFRLDDPQRETGIEFMVVTDGAGDRPVTYQVPMTYRAAPLAGADGALIGTSQHGVLGLRYLYDGTRDLVLVAQLVAAIQGAAEPQAQSISLTPDPRVTSQPAWSRDAITVTGSSVAADGPPGTDLRVETAGANGPLSVRVHRVLEPGTAAQPGLAATWRQPDGTTGHGIFASVQGPAVP